MFGENVASDKALLKTVTQRLARGTASQSRATATVQGGTVTLSGSLRFEAQRIPILKEIARIAGVRRVIDQLRLLPRAVQPTPLPVEESSETGEQ
jgi:osmotically-inducible protein OsmY